MRPFLSGPAWAGARHNLWLSVLILLPGCGSDVPDAWGNFEATEIVISAEVGGQLLRFDALEGRRVTAGDVVAFVDTTRIALQIAEIRAQRESGRAQTDQAGAQVGALQAQLSSSEREYARILRLFDAEAATQQQLELAATQVAVLREQIRAARDLTVSSREQTGALDARMAQLEDMIQRSRVRAPRAGTVLASYVRAGELVQPGQPLFRMADLDTIVLRAYVSGADLARVTIGQRVQVRFDAGPGEIGTRPGIVTWISSSAEFTPTPIQTRDERADLVYAVKVRVPNEDGTLKIGMPGELLLVPASADDAGAR
jgi:HlyD family secretion protein